MAWVACAATSRLPAADPGVAQLTQGHGTFLDLLPKIALGNISCFHTSLGNSVKQRPECLFSSPFYGLISKDESQWWAGRQLGGRGLKVYHEEWRSIPSTHVKSWVA